MRSIWLIFGGLVFLLLGIRFYPHRPAAALVASRPTSPATVLLAAERRPAAPQPPAEDARRDSVVRFALRQVGVPYLYAGANPVSGFDCSGFVAYVFAHFGVPTPHSTALLIEVGQPVARADARPGDIVVFTGTAPTSTTPGHAGIVISAPGETPLRFVHASSARRESGVKVSQIENSDYERRFMQVRRVLGGHSGAPAAPSKTPQVAIARPASAVSTLPGVVAREVAAPAAPLPARVSPVAVRPRPAATHRPINKVAAPARRQAAPRTASRTAAGKQQVSKKAPTPAAPAKHRRVAAARKTAKR